MRGLALLVGALPVASCSDEVTGPSDLVGGVWKLQSMEPAGASRFEPDDPDRFTIEFRDDGRVGVVADCNQCGGSYTVGRGMLTVSALACTLIACPTPQGGQFASLIDGTSALDKDGADRLELESSEGRLVLVR
jgi:heat shock protein HslJ